MILSMFEKFYIGEPVFFFFACWATWMTGRAVALSWESMGRLVAYCLLLAAAVRFLHFALYQGPLLSLLYYVADFIVLTIIGIFAYRYTRTNQMVNQYNWLYERTSPFGWRSKA